MARLGVVQPKDHKLIPMLQGKFAKVDNDLFEELNKYLWRSSLGYAVCRIAPCKKYIWMHRVVINCPDGLEVDHINGDKTDNRRCNLRPCTKVENQGNRWKSKHAKTSKYKGVYFCKKIQKFAAYGREGKKNRRLGTFASEDDAGRCYNAWASKYFGEFARLNPIPL